MIYWPGPCGHSLSQKQFSAPQIPFRNQRAYHVLQGCFCDSCIYLCSLSGCDDLMDATRENGPVDPERAAWQQQGTGDSKFATAENQMA